MDRAKLIKILDESVKSGFTQLDSRYQLVFQGVLDRGLEDRLISKEEHSSYLSEFYAAQNKLFNTQLTDKSGVGLTKTIISKSGKKTTVAMTIEDSLDYDKDEHGVIIHGTNRIKDDGIESIFPDGSTKPAKIQIPNNATEYKAYRAEMYKRHKEQQGKVTEERVQDTQPSITAKTSTASGGTQYPSMSPSPLTWMLMLLVGVLSGLWAQRKGYNFFCWMFAAAGSFFTCFLVLPFLKDVNQASSEDREGLIRTGNITGIVLSCAYPALLLLLGLSLVGK